MVSGPYTRGIKTYLVISLLWALLLFPLTSQVLSQNGPPHLPVVSLTTSTTFEGDLNALVEDQGTDLTVRFDLDVPAPTGGLRIFVDSDVEQIINRLDLPGFVFNPRTVNISPASFSTSFDNSGFALTLTEGATCGTFSITVFDNPEPDTYLPATFDGLVEATLSLKTQDEVEPEDQIDISGISAYTIDPNAGSSVVLFADDASQLPPPGPQDYDEAVAGDLSGDPATPTPLTLIEGTTLLSATSATGDVEYVTVTIPDGLQLDAIILQAYASVGGEDSSDDVAFAAVQSGSTFTEPPNGTNVANLLGYSHFGPGTPAQVGTDLLDDLGQGEGAIGFIGPLPSGTYTFWLQQAGESTDYTLAFMAQDISRICHPVN